MVTCREKWDYTLASHSGAHRVPGCTLALPADSSTACQVSRHLSLPEAETEALRQDLSQVTPLHGKAGLPRLFALHHPATQQAQGTFPEPQPLARSVLGTVTYLFRSSACPPCPRLPWTRLCLVEEDTRLLWAPFISLDNGRGKL